MTLKKEFLKIDTQMEVLSYNHTDNWEMVWIISLPQFMLRVNFLHLIHPGL